MKTHIQVFVAQLLVRVRTGQVTYDHAAGVVDGLMMGEALTLEEGRDILTEAYRASALRGDH